MIYKPAATGPAVAMSFGLALLHGLPTGTIAQVMVRTGLPSLIRPAPLA